MYSLVLGFTIFILSCEADKLEKEIASIPVDFEFIRFDLEFANTSPDSLNHIKKKYPYFFPSSVPDSIWKSKMNDSLQQQLQFEVAKVFPENDDLQFEIKHRFQAIKYYFPDFIVPKTVLTTTSDVEYHYKVILTDTLVILSLDTFLGSDHDLYRGVYDYIKVGMTPDHIGPELAIAFLDNHMIHINRPTLIEAMIQEGQKLYAAQKLCSSASEALLLHYSEDEYLWAQSNARFVWEYLIANDYLFSTQPQLFNRFIAPAPFSKFYMDIDQETPGALGVFVGLQIVKTYMERIDVDLNTLLNTRPEVIFNAAKYKP